MTIVDGLAVTPELLDMQDTIRESLESAICSEMHPRSSITIIIQELDVDGRVLSTAVNAACLGLMDASVSMHSMIAGVTVGVHNETGELIVNPTGAQLEDCAIDMTFVFDSVNYSTISMETNGDFAQKQFFECLKAAKAEAKRLFQFYRTTLSQVNS